MYRDHGYAFTEWFAAWSMGWTNIIVRTCVVSFLLNREDTDPRGRCTPSVSRVHKKTKLMGGICRVPYNVKVATLVHIP